MDDPHQNRFKSLYQWDCVQITGGETNKVFVDILISVGSRINVGATSSGTGMCENPTK